MRPILVFVLLLTCASAQKLVFKSSDTNINCTASGKFDYFYHHYENSCAKLDIVTCEGKAVSLWGESKHRWTCRFNEVEGYIADTFVGEDHKTLRVTMTPRSNPHPVIYILMNFLSCIILLLLFSVQPKFMAGYMIGSWSLRDDSPNWVERTTYT